MKKVVIILCSLLPLLGCQQIAMQKHEYIRNRAKDYLTSFAIAPLEIPPGLASPVSTENYPLPEGLLPFGQLTRVSLVPPEFGVVSEPQL